MNKLFYFVVSVLAIFCLVDKSYLNGCPLCDEIAGTTNKPFFYDEQDIKNLNKDPRLKGIL